MKIKSLWMLASLSLWFLPSEVLGQGTAFTYQGALTDGGAPANGLYDLRFLIYDAGSGGNVVAGPITNSPTAVSSGLFTVTLDFGTGVFTGPPRWLHIGVRTNGASSFVALTPRQLLTPSPYAITAGNVVSNGLPARFRSLTATRSARSIRRRCH